ncbi:Uncharacterized protein PECH_004669 [Penicillium ucsense]|uniref:Rhodopsin domain-containing protein n=1 Tax=Penicillium ucsense TaxID=2839758 RepID=A0A8J8W7N6_9EURO|nr:Uncharacterized protein PECM_003426 [Penicillium ucsense]KAF7736864.1 Uncharacterized protein PECH_004669 [Penicillium ucsense]
MAPSHPYSAINTINLVTQCLCIPIVSIFVALRFYVRFRFRMGLGVEDYACALAWALFIAYCAIGIVLGQDGGGYHFDELTQDDQTNFKKFTWISTIIYCPMALCVKIALLAILTRIFAPYRGKVWFIYILLAGLCIYYTIALVIKIRICNPVSLYWQGTKEEIENSCLDQRAAFLADAVISAMSDMVILVLPLPLTWSLQMSRNRKLRVIGILGAGGLATGFSIYRVVLVSRVQEFYDLSMFFIRVIMSGNAEAGIGLVCACLPTVNILISHYRKASSSKRYYSSNSLVQIRARKSPHPAHSASHVSTIHDYESQTDHSHFTTASGALHGIEPIRTEDRT